MYYTKKGYLNKSIVGRKQKLVATCPGKVGTLENESHLQDLF